MNKKWQVYNVNEAQVEEIINNNNVNKLIATILSNRGITNQKILTYF